MSFADKLRNNYKVTDSKPLYINCIISCVKDKAMEVSKTSRTVSGYAGHGFEDWELGNNPFLYLYETHFGKYEKAIKTFYPYNIYMYNTNDKEIIVKQVTSALLEEGFYNVIVRAEETKKSFKIGHTEFLGRTKTVEFPAFKIYISVSW